MTLIFCRLWSFSGIVFGSPGDQVIHSTMSGLAASSKKRPDAAQPFASVLAAATKVTPEKSQKSCVKKTHKYYAFQLQTGKDEYITGWEEAFQFEEDFASIITDRKSFRLKNLFDKHIAARERDFASGKNFVVKTEKPPAPENVPPPTREEKEAGETFKKIMSDSTPSDKIVGYVKTTSTSSVAVIVLRFVSIFGTDTWSFKADLMVPYLNHYPDVVTVSNPLLLEALRSMTYAFASDPNSNDKNKKLTVVLKGNRGDYTIDESRAYTYITIPYGDFSNQLEETSWLEETVPKILHGIREVLNSHVFKVGLEDNTYRSNYVTKLYEPGKKGNLPSFMSSAKVKMESLNHLTDHIIQREADAVMQHLFLRRIGRSKYKPILPDNAGLDDDNEKPESNDSTDETEAIQN